MKNFRLQPPPPTVASFEAGRRRNTTAMSGDVHEQQQRRQASTTTLRPRPGEGSPLSNRRSSPGREGPLISALSLSRSSSGGGSGARIPVTLWLLMSALLYAVSMVVVQVRVSSTQEMFNNSFPYESYSSSSSTVNYREMPDCDGEGTLCVRLPWPRGSTMQQPRRPELSLHEQGAGLGNVRDGNELVTTSMKRFNLNPNDDSQLSHSAGAVHVPRKGIDAFYGGLKIFKNSRDGSFERIVNPRDHVLYHEEKRRQIKDMAIGELPREYSEHYDDVDWSIRKDHCYRPRTTYAVYPSCNTFHERSLGLISDPDNPSEFLGKGSYRASWSLPDSTVMRNTTVPDVVLKQLRLREDLDINAKTLAQVRVEAMSMERTTWSDRTTNIHGHCAISILVERAYPIEYKLIHDYHFPKNPASIAGPQNHLTSQQKLSVALSMAEGLALLHGNFDGVIVNDDIQLAQWLLGRDNKIKLNDFNKAIIMKWNPLEKSYCDFSSMYTHQYRAPEQLGDSLPVDERADVFAFGQILYTVLTGMVPHYDRGSRDEALRLNMNGGSLPYVDPAFRNSTDLIERRLVEIMEPCYVHRREDRTSIFHVVRHLRETVRLYEQAFPNDPRISDVPLGDIVEDGFAMT